jgi:hypothetical protein
MTRGRFDKADCLFRSVLGAAFIVLGLLYIPWLILLGVAIYISLLFSCTRLAHRFGLRGGPKERNHG